MARQCPKPKRKRDATWFRDKVLLVEAQGNGKVLNDEELEFFTDPGIAEGPVTQTLTLSDFSLSLRGIVNKNNVFKNESKEKEVKNIDTEIALGKKVKELDNIISLGFQNPFYLKKAQQIRPMLYDSNVIAKETNVISIADSEDTLLLEEESRSKMLLKQSDPMVLEKKVNTKQINYAELNRLSKDFEVQTVFNQMEAAVQQYHVDKQCFEIQKKQFLIENDRLLDQIISQDIVNIVVNSSADVNTSVKVNSFVVMNDSVNNLFELNNLKAELQEKDTTIEKLKANIKRMYKLDPVTLALKDKNNRETHIYYLNHTIEQADILREIVEQAISLNPLDSASYSACNSMFDARHELCFLEFVSDMNASSKSKSVKKAKKKEEWKPTGKVITATNKVPLREPIPLESIAHEFVVTKVYTRRPKVPKTNGSNSKPKIAKYVISDITNVDTSQGSLQFLYLLLLLSISACAMGKIKKQSHKPKSEDTNQEKLYLLHMDLCGPMRVASINEKKYILIIVDDYSRFTWVKFLALKDEAPDFIIKFLKKIQVRLNTPVRNIHTDNRTEFVNQTLPRRTRKIIETIHVDFDELTAMASELLGSGPGLQSMTLATSSSGLVPNTILQQP
ncbi:integrase, catalytic region, zinc finger, CCHC-type containing protein [Tanacetum coccineum]